MLGNAITQVAVFVQRQNATIEGSRTLMSSLVDEVNIHGDNFQKVGMITQVYEQYIVRSGVVTQEMDQYVNELIKDNEQKSLRIESLVREC